MTVVLGQRFKTQAGCALRLHWVAAIKGIKSSTAASPCAIRGYRTC
jgi:hypothetical protein